MATNKKKRKKRPPPKPVKVKPKVKKKPKVSRVKVSTQIVVGGNPVPDDTPTEGYAWLRRLAGIKYITSQSAITVGILLKDPEIAGKVTRRTLDIWCGEDGWVRERQKYYDNLESTIRKKMEEKQIKSTIEELQDLDALASNMHQKLSTNEVEPGSFEGMTTALMRVETKREDLRERIAREVAPEGMVEGVVPGASPVVPELSEEEAREAAMLILKKRQKAAQQRLLESNENGESVDTEG